VSSYTFAIKVRPDVEATIVEGSTPGEMVRARSWLDAKLWAQAKYKERYLDVVPCVELQHVQYTDVPPQTLNELERAQEYAAKLREQGRRNGRREGLLEAVTHLRVARGELGRPTDKTIRDAICELTRRAEEL
jgi:hypothetical protein